MNYDLLALRCLVHIRETAEAVCHVKVDFTEPHRKKSIVLLIGSHLGY